MIYGIAIIKVPQYWKQRPTKGLSTPTRKQRLFLLLTTFNWPSHYLLMYSFIWKVEFLTHILCCFMCGINHKFCYCGFGLRFDKNVAICNHRFMQSGSKERNLKLQCIRDESINKCAAVLLNVCCQNCMWGITFAIIATEKYLNLYNT